MKRFGYGAAALGLLGAAICSPTAFAAANIDIELNGSYLFASEMPITNIAVANPEIADIVRPSGHGSEVLIVGIGSGSTTLFVWYEDGTVEEYTITVGLDDIGQARAIQRAIGLPNVRVQVVSKSGSSRRILLRGTVKNQAEHETALKVASLYANSEIQADRLDDSSTKTAESIAEGSDFEYDFDYRSSRIYDNIIDLLTIESPSQIRLEAQIIEISHDDASNIGFKFDGTGSTIFANVGEFYGGESFEHNFARNNVSLSFLIQQGRAKVLSRPSVSTVSGSKARIFIGGQIPVPVSDGNGGETIQWKDYGIRLNIRPTLQEDGTITAEVHAGVSRLDYSNLITTSSTSVPSVTAREAHSIVHLDNGASMVVGGLLNSEDIKNVTKIPILSSIPIIGEFFKHTETTTEQREMIILITPIVVDGSTPARMSDKMRDTYEKGRQEANSRHDVDLNEDKKAREAAEAKKAEEEARGSGSQNSRSFFGARQRTEAERNEGRRPSYDLSGPKKEPLGEGERDSLAVERGVSAEESETSSDEVQFGRFAGE